MKTMLLTIIMLLSSHAFCASLPDASSEYTIKDIPAETPKTVLEKQLKENKKARSAAISSAISEIDKKCIDPNWGNASQVDIIGVKDETLDSGGGFTVNKVTVSAICRDLN